MNKLKLSLGGLTILQVVGLCFAGFIAFSALQPTPGWNMDFISLFLIGIPTFFIGGIILILTNIGKEELQHSHRTILILLAVLGVLPWIGYGLSKVV